MFAAVGLLLVGVGGRLTWLAESQRASRSEQANRQHTARAHIKALRGSILDCNGRTLAGSQRRPSLIVDPSRVTDVRAACRRIETVLGVDADWLERRITERRGRRYFRVKRRLSDRERARFERASVMRELGAFFLEDEPLRVHPLGRSAAHVVGYVGADQRGLAGVELTCDELLTGKDGSRTAIVDSRRRRLEPVPDAALPAVDGCDVVLTIDAYLQSRAQFHLAQAVETHNAEWGTALLMDPDSGEILAMAVTPDFDPDAPIRPDAEGRELDAEFERIRNHAIADQFEPGSIFKPFVAGPAVSDEQASLDEQFEINGPTHAFGTRIVHDTHPHAVLELASILSKSSNIGMAMLGEKLGAERVHDYVARFEFGRRTGIRLPGEHSGALHALRDWTRYSVQSVPFGQEVAVTPIQVLRAFLAFCNDGLLYQPRIVRAVLRADGSVRKDYSQPVVVRRVMRAEAVRDLRRRALVEVVNSGTGTRAQLADYQVFGKTGTAQIARRDGRGYEPGAYVGSFMGGAPADNPRLAVLVSLYHPRGGKYYGGTVSAPAAREILADGLAYLHVPRDLARSASVSGTAQAD